MNKSKIQNIILLILFLNTFLLNAENRRALGTEYNIETSYLTVNLLSSLNTMNPRWRLGYIKSIAPKWKLGLDIGFGNSNTSYTDLGGHIEEDYQIWEIRPELYYLIKPSKKHVNYISAELFYINHRDVFHDSHYFSKKGGCFAYDQANYQREKYGINFKYGFLFFSKKKLGLNMYTGLGLRIRNNGFSKVLNPHSTDLGAEGGDMFGFSAYKTDEGVNFGVNFSFGLKLCYRLNN